MISIVIPAHNEEAVIGRCLRSITQGAKDGELEIVVACNGCTDKTAEVAREFEPSVKVVETDQGSKVIGLNLGDRHATVYPRIYVDADVRIGIDAIREVAGVLDRGEALAAAPRMEVDFEGSPWVVRAYYKIWTRLPYHRDEMIGSGVYAMSEAGRSRFEQFPDIFADDGYVEALFQPGERKSIKSCSFMIKSPRTFWGLIKIKTRIRVSMHEFRRQYPQLIAAHPKRFGPCIREILCTPSLWASALAYIVIVLVTRLRAKTQLKRITGYHWERDESARVS